MRLIKHRVDYRGVTPPAGLMEAMGEFVGEYIKQGKFIDGGGLMSTHRGKRVVLHGGKLSVVDGPFVESKEIVGGYALLELAFDDEALAVYKKFMELHQTHWPEFEGESELRPLQTGVPGSE